MQKPDYTAYAGFYDYFELAGCEESEELNLFLHELFTANGVSKVADLACGTGAQTIGLARLGYSLESSDISEEMLSIARKKAAELENARIEFACSDMMNAEPADADAIICIYNSIGHLSRGECQSFFTRLFAKMKAGAIFVFDILNFTALQCDGLSEYEYMSREAVIDGLLVQHSRSCELNQDLRQLSVDSITRWQDGRNKPGQHIDHWQMQIYDCSEINEMLTKAGFGDRVIFGATGTEFVAESSDSILVVCEK